MKSNILKKACVLAGDLDEMTKKCFIDHYNNNENIYILTNNKNIEYKIISFDGVKFELLFTNRVVQ